MPRRVLLSSLIALVSLSVPAGLLAEAPPRRNAGAVPPQPNIALVSGRDIPANGVIVFSESLPGGPTPAVRDASGADVPGSFESLPGNQLVFRPAAPLTVGSVLTLSAPPSSVGVPFSANVTVVSPGDAKVPDLTLSLVADVGVSEVWIECFADAQRTRSLRRLREVREVTAGVSGTLLPEAVAPELTELVYARVRTEGPSQEAYARLPLSPSTLVWSLSGTSLCATLEVIDLRTLTVHTDAPTCVQPAEPAGVTNTTEDIAAFLAIAQCPFPDMGHQSAWCGANRAACSGGVCAGYDAACSYLYPGRDAGMPPAGDAGVSAPEHTQDAQVGPEARDRDSDGGCGVRTRGGHAGGQSGALIALLATLCTWRRRRRQR